VVIASRYRTGASGGPERFRRLMSFGARLIYQAVFRSAACGITLRIPRLPRRDSLEAFDRYGDKLVTSAVLHPWPRSC